MLPGQLPAKGPIELQAFGGQIWFRNLRIRELNDKGEQIGAGGGQPAPKS
jgi:hypothetical protein